jgi:glycosyltransferase involved in cell wall biosynthesis
MKVSLFVHELSGNPIVRAYPIAKAIQYLGHEVEVLGLTYNTDEIYAPYRDEFEYKTVKSYLDIRWVVINSHKLSKLATGEMVYAFKALWDSYYPALLYSGFGVKRRLLMDAEDNELWDAFIGNGWKDIFKSKYYPINPIYNKILHPATYLTKRKTVATTQLQKRYGGKIVLHGPNYVKFDPELFPDKAELRKKYNLPEQTKFLLFAGKPVYYNGLPFLIDALSASENSNWRLLLAGDANHPLFMEAKEKLGERCHLLGFIPNNDMPEILKVADVVPIIQTPIPTTEMQMPAKMLEAMCMAKGIIVTNVGDLPGIIGKENGWVIPYNNKAAFTKVLGEISGNEMLLEQKGSSARRYFVENASIQEIARRIEPYFQKK